MRSDAVAAMFLHPGDKENAIRWLQRAVDDRSASVGAEMFDDPLIRDDPPGETDGAAGQGG